MRIFLLSMTALSTVAAASALTFPSSLRPSGPQNARHVSTRFPGHLKADPSQSNGRMMARSPRATRADQTLSMNWGYCEGINMAEMMDQGIMKGAIIMPAELATEYAGATISSISMGTPLDVTTGVYNPETYDYEYENPIRDVTVWLAEDLDKDPFISVDAKLSKEGFIWNTIELPEAYTIEAGKQVVIGFTIEVPENEDGSILPFVNDYSYDFNEYSCLVYTNMVGYDDDFWPIYEDERQWKNLGYEWGNIAIRAMISGDMLPVDKVETVAWQGPSYVAPGDDFQYLMILRNMGANDITEAELTIEIDGMEPQTASVKIDPAVPYFEYSDILAFDFKATTVGNNIGYKCYLSGINGKKLDEPGTEMTGAFLCIEEGYPKNNVFEEATGTWCGWCVVGYAGMEYMAENYADKGFIGIAVHSGDRMEVMEEGQAYESFGYYVQGFPSAYVNRNMGADVYPSPDYLEEEFEYIKDIPAYAKISAELNSTDDAKVLHLSTQTEFSDSEENAPYMIGYTVIEDEVGPYMQTNYTSGSSEDYYGFQDMPEKVSLLFNDVARNCSRPMGIEESLPVVIKKGESYAYDTDITLTGVTNPEKVRVVAMVINGLNGAIENAVSLKSPIYSGVKNIAVSSADEAFVYGASGALRFRVNPAKANVYAIDGHRVAAGVKGMSLDLPAGIYLVELNGKVCKVMVR